MKIGSEYKSQDEEEAVKNFNAERVEKIEPLVQDAEKSFDTNSKVDIQAIFDSYSELSKIGSVEDYTNYLETIFPDSKVTNICYRGTGDETEFIDKAGTNQTVVEGAVFFTSEKEVANYYRKKITHIRGGNGKVYPSKLNITKPFEAYWKVPQIL